MKQFVKTTLQLLTCRAMCSSNVFVIINILHYLIIAGIVFAIPLDVQAEYSNMHFVLVQVTIFLKICYLSMGKFHK